MLTSSYFFLYYLLIRTPQEINYTKHDHYAWLRFNGLQFNIFDLYTNIKMTRHKNYVQSVHARLIIIGHRESVNDVNTFSLSFPTHIQYLPLRRMVIGAVPAWELLLVTWGWVLLLVWQWRPAGPKLASVAAPRPEPGLLTAFWISKNFNSLISMALQEKQIKTLFGAQTLLCWCTGKCKMFFPHFYIHRSLDLYIKTLIFSLHATV